VTTTAKTMRERLAEGRTLWAAGAYDALSARLIEAAGFDFVFTTGFGISASVLGEPDVELYTMTENLNAVRQMAFSVACPVVADCDTGYGNAINVRRTVREFESAGVAGLVIEDQEVPKRCPAIKAKVSLTPIDEGVSKIRAALHARRDPDLLIIARTDAVDVDEAIDRAQAYTAAGADLIQPIARCIPTERDLRRLKAGVSIPLSIPVNMDVEKLPPQLIAEVAGIAFFPLVPLLTVAAALQANLAALHAARSSQDLPLPRMGIGAFSAMIGFPRLEALHSMYLGEASPQDHH